MLQCDSSIPIFTLERSDFSFAVLFGGREVDLDRAFFDALVALERIY